MKNTFLYLALAGAFVATASLQSHKETTINLEKQEAVTVYTDSVDRPEFVDESLEKYAEYDTRTKLYAAFGEENIKDGQWGFDNTSNRKSSRLTDPNNGKIYDYVWGKDGESLYMIEAHYRVIKANDTEKQRQIIDFRNGIYTGMPAEELEEWNGAPYSFVGFGHSQAGLVSFGKFSDVKIIVKLGYDESLKKEAPKSIKNFERVSSNNAPIEEFPLFVDYIALKVK